MIKFDSISSINILYTTTPTTLTTMSSNKYPTGHTTKLMYNGADHKTDAIFYTDEDIDHPVTLLAINEFAKYHMDNYPKFWSLGHVYHRGISKQMFKLIKTLKDGNYPETIKYKYINGVKYIRQLFTVPIIGRYVKDRVVISETDLGNAYYRFTYPEAPNSMIKSIVKYKGSYFKYLPNKITYRCCIAQYSGFPQPNVYVPSEIVYYGKRPTPENYTKIITKSADIPQDNNEINEYVVSSYDKEFPPLV